MTIEELDLILDNHKKWLQGTRGGVKADLSNANLRYTNLRYTNLSNANLRYTNLSNVKNNKIIKYNKSYIGGSTIQK